MKHKLKNIPLFLVLTCMLVLNQSHAPPKQRTPNIILIFMDDLGYGDLSCYGAVGIHTPNIDKLAAEGIRLTNFMSAQAVCSASRAALMTGSYPNRVGISGALSPNSPVGLAREEMTIAELLKQKNYATGIFGKWHLGDAKEFLPLQQGFDEYLGIPYSNDMWPVDYSGEPARKGSYIIQYPPLPLIKNYEPIKIISTLDDQAKLTELITDEAIGFIKRNKNKPFFAYIPHPMPHVPINASPAFIGKSKRGLYGDVIQEVDYHVGRIMKTLKEEGLEENTLVIFTSDNGPWLNFGDHAGSTGGLREGKGTSFEGGQREPCIVRWKGVVPAGIVSNQLTSTIDILPTLAALVEVPLPERKIDGVDISSVLKGDLHVTARKTFLYYYRRNSLEAVRRDNWKLVFEHKGRSYVGQKPGVGGFPGNAPEDVLFPEALYNLETDPTESNDVRAKYPEIVSALKVLADEARKELGDDLQKIPGSGRRGPGELTK